jgi:hypothetical protein
MSHFLLTLIALIALVGCQVEEKSGNGTLIAGHTPATNSFTVSSTPAAGTYFAGRVLSFTLSFPYNVDISGGTPSLSLTIGASTVSAPLTSGAGTPSLTFQYTVLASENDTDGITLNSLAPNGAAMTFTSNGATTNCNTASVTARTYASILVDNTGPTLTGLALVTPPGFYNEGDHIIFSATYSEPVVVGTPDPAIRLTFNNAATAVYFSGSGTNTINFRYTVTATQFDYNGYAFPAPRTFDNGASITDASGNAASVDFSAFFAAIDGAGTGPTCNNGTSDCVEFDGRVPFVVNIVPPTPGNYAAAQNLDYVVEFNKNVTVTGSPHLALTVGSTTRQASYSSGSGTRFITFRYTTVPGDVDPDGITSPTSITANGGNIVGGATYFTSGTGGGSFTNNLFTAPDTSGVIITATQPQPMAVIRGGDTTNRVFPLPAQPDDVWIIGQPLLITVEFNTGMTVGQVSGTPSIPLTIGATTRQATYLSGGDGQTSLVFRYVIQEGDLDTDGSIALGNIELNGGTITDSANTNSLLTLPVTSVTSTTVDGVRPTLLNVTAPADASYSSVTVPGTFNFTINWSEAVNFSGTVNLPLTIGVASVNASTVVTNNATGIVVRPNNINGMTDTDGITVISPLNGGTISDAAGNTANTFTFAPPVTTGVLVDTTAPTINIGGVTRPPAGTYNAGDDLIFTVTFSEIVNVQNAGAYPNSYPRIALAFSSGTQYATYTGGSGTNTLTFSYEVTTSDSHTGTIPAPAAVEVNTPTSYIRDIAWNGNGTTSYAMTTSLAGVIVDGVAPSVSDQEATAGVYVESGEGPNSTIVIEVTYSEPVTVTGVPEIELDIATGPKAAVYDAVSSTSTILRFRYPIDGATDMDLDGLALTSPAEITGATIEDYNGNEADYALGAVTNLNNVFIAPHLAVWTRASLNNNRSGFTGAPGVAGPGVVGGYYNFTGTESLSFGGLSGYTSEQVWMAIRTPNSGDATQDLINTYVNIANPSTGTISYAPPATGPSPLAASSNHRILVNFGAGTSISDTFTPAGFTGRIGAVIISTETLSGGQQAEVDTFMSTNYP